MIYVESTLNHSLSLRFCVFFWPSKSWTTKDFNVCDTNVPLSKMFMCVESILYIKTSFHICVKKLNTGIEFTCAYVQFYLYIHINTNKYTKKPHTFTLYLFDRKTTKFAVLHFKYAIWKSYKTQFRIHTVKVGCLHQGVRWLTLIDFFCAWWHIIIKCEAEYIL